MQSKLLLVIENLIKDSSADLSQDILNYAKYLAIKGCPKEKKNKLEEIMSVGKIKDFVEFCVAEVPQFSENFQKYINKYANN